MNTLSATALRNIVIILSIIIAGVFFLVASRGFSNQGKYVEVKGLAETIVKADRGVWSMSLEVKSNDISDLYQQIDQSTGTITSFLVNQGFSEEEVNVAPVNVYQDTYRDALYRYNANLQMSVYTDKVDLLRATSEDTTELIRQGVVFSNSYINFEFTDINSIKPALLEEAISNARQSAREFADDSKSRIGDIARANQGVISITDKDPASPEYKNIRLVTTVRYILK